MWRDKCLLYDRNVVHRIMNIWRPSFISLGISVWRFFSPYLIGIYNIAVCAFVCRPPAMYLWEVWLHVFYTLLLELGKVILPLPSFFKADLTLLTQLLLILHVPQPLYHLGDPWLDMPHCVNIFFDRGVQNWIQYSSCSFTTANQMGRNISLDLLAIFLLIHLLLDGTQLKYVLQLSPMSSNRYAQ